MSKQGEYPEWEWIQGQEGWLRDKYAGLWIAVVGDRLVAVGDSEVSVLKKATRLGYDDAFTYYVPSEHEPAIVAGERMGEWLIYHKEPITLHSGGKSHWFVDGQAIFDDEHLREAVLDFWEGALKPPLCMIYNEPCIVGVPTGGVVWAQALAERMGWPVFEVLEIGKAGGVAAWSERRFTVLVDDVMTTGASLLPHIHNELGLRKFAVVGRGDWIYRNKRPRDVTAWVWIDLEMRP